MTADERKRWLAAALARNGAPPSQEQLLDQMAELAGAKRATVERGFRRWRKGGRMSPKYVELMAQLLGEQEVPNTPSWEDLLDRLEALEVFVRGEADASNTARQGLDARVTRLERRLARRERSAAEGSPVGT